jgi:hypothetical protein
MRAVLFAVFAVFCASMVGASLLDRPWYKRTFVPVETFELEKDELIRALKNDGKHLEPRETLGLLLMAKDKPFTYLVADVYYPVSDALELNTITPSHCTKERLGMRRAFCDLEGYDQSVRTYCLHCHVEAKKLCSELYNVTMDFWDTPDS